MTAIKGQNLRLLINGLCVAVAQSCQIHLTANVESISSKDDTDNWERKDVTGLSWDASADALITDGAAYTGTMADEGCLIDLGSEEVTVYAVNEAFELAAGQTLHIKTTDSGTLYVGSGTPTNGLTMLASSTDGLLVYTAEEDITVYIAHDLEDADVGLFLHDEDYDAVNLSVGDTVAVEVDVTTGTNNRAVSTQLLTGSAVISDLSINAQNRANSSFSVQLTGTGTLEVAS